MSELDPYLTALQKTAWRAPCKLNLFFHIVGKFEQDPYQGYHEIQTVFQLLNYSDTLFLNLDSSSEIHLTCENFPIPNESNLIVQAARLLKDFAKTQGIETPGVKIHLEKKLPIGGGVGGGSSNAATTLLVLNELWKLYFNPSILLELAEKLGADVPFFVLGENAFGEGIGTTLTPFYIKPKWYVVLIPHQSVSTETVFKETALTAYTTKVKIGNFVTGFGKNDFQEAVCKNYSEVKQALDWLGQFAPSRLTGTGSCVFAAFNSKKRAKFIISKIPSAFSGFLAHGISHSPTHLQLKKLKKLFGV